MLIMNLQRMFFQPIRESDFLNPPILLADLCPVQSEPPNSYNFISWGNLIGCLNILFKVKSNYKTKIWTQRKSKIDCNDIQSGYFEYSEIRFGRASDYSEECFRRWDSRKAIRKIFFWRIGGHKNGNLNFKGVEQAWVEHGFYNIRFKSFIQRRT